MPRENENQGNNGAQPPRPPRRSKRDMRADIRVLEDQLREAEEGQQRAEEEAQALRTQINGQPAGRPNRRANAEADDAGAANQTTLSKSEIKAWKSKAKVAGGRAAALYEPFLNTELLAGHQVQTHIDEVLDDVKRAQDSDEELEDLYNPAVYWNTPRFGTPEPIDLVREMIYHLPKSPGNTWLEEWFQEKLKEGVRKQRGAIVHGVKVYYEKIFGFRNPAFEDNSLRPNLAEVQALRNFLHINEKDDNGDLNLDVFFKDIIIVKVLRLLLLGRSAIENGKRSSKARKSYAKLWHVTCITPSLLAYAATIIQYTFSGDSFFEEGAGTINYTNWFHARLRLLKGVYEQHPDVYADLMSYYNKEVLGIDRQGANEDQDGGAQEDVNGNDGMDVDDQAFLAQIGAA